MGGPVTTVNMGSGSLVTGCVTSAITELRTVKTVVQTDKSVLSVWSLIG